MAQGKSIPTVLKKQGKRVVRYRDARGKWFSGTITSRASASQGTFLIRMGGTKVSKASKNVASTGMKQTDVVYFTGH
jgi:hypothetical protein